MDPQDFFPITCLDRSTRERFRVDSIKKFPLYIEEVYFDSRDFEFVDAHGRSIYIEFQIWTGKMRIRRGEDTEDLQTPR